MNGTVISEESLVKMSDRILLRHRILLLAIAKEEGMGRAALFRRIIEQYANVYFYLRKKFLCPKCHVVQNADNFSCPCGYKWKADTFNCQNCGRVTKNKYRHSIMVGNDLYAFGDCCFFNDAWKELAKRQL